MNNPRFPPSSLFSLLISEPNTTRYTAPMEIHSCFLFLESDLSGDVPGRDVGDVEAQDEGERDEVEEGVEVLHNALEQPETNNILHPARQKSIIKIE